jgi:phosphate transport system protein
METRIDTNIKSKLIASLDKKFQTLCEKVLQQLTFMDEILRKGMQDELYEKVTQLETDIDLLENEIRADVVMRFLYSPKAMELRRLITCQDITNFLETIGDLLFNIISHSVKKIDTSLPEFEYFQVTLEKMLAYAKKMVSDAIFSFCCEDGVVAYQIIVDDDVLDNLFVELSENLVASFQDIPLSERELTNIINISNIAYVIEQIGDIATHIAEASIYMLEGKDIRHGLSEKKQD